MWNGSLNRLSMRTVQAVLDNASELGVVAERLDGGSHMLDARRGGHEAGRLIGEICMGGLGSVTLTSGELSGTRLPWVEVRTDHPLEACLLSQLAGWAIKAGKFRALGSGPARALARVEAIYEEYPYQDDHDEAAIVLETSLKPTQKAAALIAERSRVAQGNLYIIVTPTSSLPGAVQISARIVETGLHKMHALGVDLMQVLSGSGSCPVPPLFRNDLVMMGRTNDAMLYGGRTHYVFEAADSILPRLDAIPSCSSKDYGKPFQAIFEAAGDFYKIDQGLFSPAEVSINDAATGRVLTSGQTDPEVLRSSFGLS